MIKKFAILIIFGAILLSPGTALAQAGNKFDKADQDNIVNNVINPDLPRVSATQSEAQKITEIAIMGAGLVSVIFIMIGGLKLTLSNGDPAGIKKGRDTVLYAVVGLVLSIAAFTIVRFVLGRL